MKKVLVSIGIASGILLAGCNGSDKSSALDDALLIPEMLTMNQPLEIEPYADPAVLKNLAPIRATFDNLAITKDSPTINPRMTSFAKQMAKTNAEHKINILLLHTGFFLHLINASFKF